MDMATDVAQLFVAPASACQGLLSTLTEYSKPVILPLQLVENKGVL